MEEKSKKRRRNMSYKVIINRIFVECCEWYLEHISLTHKLFLADKSCRIMP